MAVNWAQVIFNSAFTGSLYLIGAVGLTLTYGLSKFPNFAHAEFIALGVFFGYFVTEQLGLGWPSALLAAFLFSGLVGFLCCRGIFQPLAKRGSSIIHLMVASIALGFIFRHSIGAAIRAALTALSFEGASGPISFDNRGDRASGAFELWEVVKDPTTETGYKNEQIKLVTLD